VWAAIDELRAQGAFEGLDSRERLDPDDAVEERIRSERGAQIAREIEEARNKKLPKSNPTLITEKDMLNSTLDVLHRRGVLDAIIERVCEVCGEEFTATRRDSKTCSNGCRQKAYRRRRKEAQQDR
jgi:hypothetical protein